MANLISYLYVLCQIFVSLKLYFKIYNYVLCITLILRNFLIFLRLLNFRKINLIKEFLVVLSIYFFLKLLKYLDPCKLDENFIFLNKNIFLIMVCYFRVDNIIFNKLFKFDLK